MILLTEKENLTRSEGDRVRHRQKTSLISSVMLLVLNLALILPISLMAKFRKAGKHGADSRNHNGHPYNL